MHILKFSVLLKFKIINIPRKNIINNNDKIIIIIIIIIIVIIIIIIMIWR